MKANTHKTLSEGILSSQLLICWARPQKDKWPNGGVEFPFSKSGAEMLTLTVSGTQANWKHLLKGISVSISA